MKSTILYLATVAPLALAGTFEFPIHRRGASESNTFEDTKAAVLRDIARKQARYLPELASKNSKRATGSVSMTDIQTDTQYYGALTVGTPGQTLNVALDTGSGYLLLQDKDCTDCQAGTVAYDSSKSSTAKTSSTVFESVYGGGGANGTLVTDTLSFGNITVANQTFLGYTELIGVLFDNTESGLLGLGWKNLTTAGSTPLLQQMWESNLLDEPLFAMAYASYKRNPAPTALDHGGVFTIGGVNPAVYSGNISYNKLVGSPSYWNIKLDDVLVNGVSLNISADSATIDSATTLLSMPASAVDKVYSAIGNSGTGAKNLRTYPAAANPKVSLVFGGVSYEIPSFSYGAASANESYGVLYDASAGTSNHTFIIGAAFLNSVMSVYNFEIPAVGFATLVDTNDWLEEGTEPTHVSASVVAKQTSAISAGHSTASSSAAKPTATATVGGGVKGGDASSGAGRLGSAVLVGLLGACAFAALA